MIPAQFLLRSVAVLVCAWGTHIGVANAEAAAPRSAVAPPPPATPAAPAPAPKPATTPAAPNAPSAASAAAAGGGKSRVITISEVTIVGRIQKPIASVDVSRIQPKLTLAELRQPFLQRIEDAVYRAPF